MLKNENTSRFTHQQVNNSLQHGLKHKKTAFFCASNCKKQLAFYQKKGILEFATNPQETSMGKLIKIIVIAAVCIISAFGIYSLVKYNKVDENTAD